MSRLVDRAPMVTSRLTCRSCQSEMSTSTRAEPSMLISAISPAPDTKEESHNRSCARPQDGGWTRHTSTDPKYWRRSEKRSQKIPMSSCLEDIGETDGGENSRADVWKEDVVQE